MWWRNGVLYHCYVRSFQDSNGDGIGDLPGLVSRLDTLNDGTPASLGIAGLWLSPVYPSPDRDFGYDISDYRTIDPVYGTMADFDRLALETRRRGIHLIMDLVVNHSSTDHPWFRQACSSRSNPYHPYYIWREGTPGKPPNNWASTFGGSAWEWNAATGEYYLHSFLKQQADLNWRSPQLRAEVEDILRFWLERGVDGFRLDVANYYVKDLLLRDNPSTFLWSQPMPGNTSQTLCIPLRQQVPKYTVDQPETHEVLREMRSVVDERPGRMMVGEITQRSLPQVLSYYGAKNDELPLVFNFFFFVRHFRAADFRHIIAATLEGLPAGAWPAWVLSNHDVVRAVSRYHCDAAMTKAMNGLLLTLRGTPFLYNGEALGLANTPLPRRALRDPVGLRYWPLPVGRDGERTPFPWSDTKNAGFTTGTPWLPVGRPRTTYTAAAADPDSVLRFTCRLSWFRAAHPALNAGTMAFVDSPSRDVLCFTRTAENERLLVCINLSRHAVPLARHLPAAFSSQSDPSQQQLDPWEIRISPDR